MRFLGYAVLAFMAFSFIYGMYNLAVHGTIYYTPECRYEIGGC